MAAAPNITFPNRATPGWERYRDAHWEWYQQNHVGPAPTNRKKSTFPEHPILIVG